MLIAFNKPFQVLCQFTDRSTPPRRTLAEFGLPPDVYAAGRLDYDSEGLLLLTDDGRLANKLTDPRYDKPKTYWSHVEGIPTPHQLDALRAGITLSDGVCKPAEVAVLSPAPEVWPRTPPIRVRQSVPDSWLAVTIREGRNRQVRRMTAAVGLPTLRLIRVKIDTYELGELRPGEWREIGP